MEKECLKVPVASVVILERNSKYLLVQEGKEDCRNLWNLPSGRVEIDESIEDAAIRETQEETGHLIKIIKKVTVIHEGLERYVKHVFYGEIIKENFSKPEEEILDIEWFSLKELEEMTNKLRLDYIIDAIKLYESNKIRNS